MDKKERLRIILSVVFLVVFNLVFLLTAGTDHPASVWISYIFIHVAYILFLFTPRFFTKTGNTVVLGMPLMAISAVHFGITFIVGLVFIFLRLESYKVPLIVHAVITAAYVLLLVSNMLANEHTADNLERHELELEYVKGAASKLKGIMNSVSDSKLQKKVERAYDLVNSSPVKSNASVRSYELTVLNLIGELRDSVQNNDTESVESILREIETNANERNRTLKMGN